MTAAVIRFPATPDMFPCRRDDIVTAARAILRSPAPHDRETIREACHALMTWGNAMDWSEAYPVLRALDLPPMNVAPVAVKPPYSANVIRIRDVLIGSVVTVGFVWLGLALMLAQ